MNMTMMPCQGEEKVVACHDDAAPVRLVPPQTTCQSFRQATARLVADTSGIEAIIAALGAPLTIHDRDFRIVYQNRLIRDQFGDGVGQSCYRVYAGGDAVCPDCPVEHCFADGAVHRSEQRLAAGEQALIVESTASPLRNEHGDIVAAVVVLHDVTEQKETEKKNLWSKCLYEALSKTTKAIMHSRDVEALFDEVCAVAVAYGKFCLAAIAMIEPETGHIKTVAHAGRVGSYLDAIHVTTDFTRDEGRGPSNVAIRTHSPYVCNDFMTDPITVPWREAAHMHGINASATFPLQHDGLVTGVFKLYSEHKGFFVEDLLSLLGEMAENISFAMANFAREKWRQAMEIALRESEEQLKMMLEGSSDGFWDWHVASGKVLFNRRYAEILGFAPEELDPHICARMACVHPDDAPRVEGALHEHLNGLSEAYDAEFRMMTRSGQWEWIHDRGRVVAKDEKGLPLRMAGTTTIITERKRMEESLSHASTHDAMTGLFNRAFFDAELARLVQGRRFPISVLIADVDGLKLVNDSFGHLEGDRLIRLAARALKDSFRPDDIVARIGGDEFGVLLPAADEHALDDAVRRVLQSQEVINREDRPYVLSISIGAATAEHGYQLAEAVHLADARMYRFKRERKRQGVTVIADEIQVQLPGGKLQLGR